MQWHDASSCRTCLQKYNKAEPMFSIFEEVNWENGVNQGLQECLGVELQNHERLPARICAKCMEALDKALSFRRMCLASQERLLEAMSKVSELDTPAVAIYDDTNYISAGNLSEELMDYSVTNDSDEEFVPTPTKRKPKKPKVKTQTHIEIKLEKETETIEQKPKKASITKYKSAAGVGGAVPAPGQIMCEICGNIYNKRSLLELHMRRHLKLKSFKCEICDKAFVAKMEMHRHMRVHTGARPFKCTYCQRAFGDVSTVKKHERTHTKERPFVCQTCGKDFAYSHVLKDHMLTHTGEKRFSCQPCNKTFARIHLLKQHMGTLTHKQTAAAAGEL